MILVMSSEFFVKNIKDDDKMMNESFVFSWNSMLTEVAAGCPIWSTRYLTPPYEIANAVSDNKANTDFDYFHYLLDSDKAMETISLIGYLIKTNNIVIILYNKDFSTDWLDSMLKFIYVRYGIAARDIKCMEDIPEIPEDTDTFSIGGLHTYTTIDYHRVVNYFEELMSSDSDFREFFKKSMNEKAAEL
jgi:hypothetical protein